MCVISSRLQKGVVIKSNTVIKFWKIEAKLNLGKSVLNNALKFLGGCTRIASVLIVTRFVVFFCYSNQNFVLSNALKFLGGCTRTASVLIVTRFVVFFCYSNQ